MSKERLVTHADGYQDLDWSRAEERAFGENTGLEQESQTFWIRLADIDFVGLAGLVSKSLEAHGWEANLENILLAMDSLRIGRRVRVHEAASGQKKRALAFERVACLSLPKKGQSSPLLSMLYALVSGSEAPARRISSGDINDHPAVQALQARLAALEDENLQLRRRERQRPKEAEQAALLLGKARPEALGLSAELGMVQLQVRSIDLDQAMVTFRGDGRAFELGLGGLTHWPEPGATGIGLRNGGSLVGVLPLGTGWQPIDYVQATVLAASGSRMKIRLPGRTESIVPLSRGEHESVAAPKRHDRVVAALAGTHALAVWAGSSTVLQAVLQERRVQLKALEHSYQLLSIFDALAGDGRFAKKPLVDAAKVPSGGNPVQAPANLQHPRPKGKVG